ncbi:MAG: hypothetical protein PHN44_00650 [Candidatus Marinimicrobia bacterium]|nr:hypothetical protein [Candidatus Neomarinimicrobiota bacterium]MDD5539125.1 hypothetical protein [Candidatus Neomarinimicrobiota bacterium]
MYEMVGQGTNLNLYDMPNYETFIEEGQRVQVRLNCIFSVPQSVLSSLQSALNYAGVEEARVTSSGNMVYITFRKGFAWLAVIASIILGLVLLAIVVTTWQIFREVGPGSSGLLIAGGFLVTLMVFYAAAKHEMPTIKKTASEYYPRVKKEARSGIDYLEKKYG